MKFALLMNAKQNMTRPCWIHNWILVKALDYVKPKTQNFRRSRFSLINDILDFSKIEAGKLELEKTDFRLEDTVASVIKILKPKTEEKGLWLTHRLDPHLPPHVSGDSVRVRQILLNFLNNAVKFTEKGGITISVFMQSQTGTHCTAKFEVTDTGVGIPENCRERLFQPFSQADSSTTRKYGGTGLGLAISRQLAELMGGTVGFETEEGKGSTFWFTATLRNAERKMINGECAAVNNECGSPDNREAESANPLPSGIGNSRLRILVAEDNFFNQKVILAMLKKFNFAADIAENGREAVETLRSKPYDLVFMDMQMPEMDGIEAVRLIRSPEYGVLNPDIPIVAMTANVTKEDRQKCLDAGMNDYIAKPIDTDRLLSVINYQLSADSGQLPVKKESVTSDNRSQNTEIFNRQDFLNRMGGNEILLKEMIADIPDHFFEVTAQLKKASERGDEKETGHLAHFLKGISANVSAERIRDIAIQMEIASKENRTDTVPALITRLEQEVEMFRSAVSDIFPELFQKSEVHESEQHSEIIMEETISRLPGLIRKLEAEFLPEWKKYTEAFFIEETEKLADRLGHMGTECRLPFLIRYSRKLQRAVQQYNFSEWEKLVAQFPEIMDRIRKLAEEPKQNRLPDRF
ncbi:MAG: ATP-binding protein [Desulfobacterales bacterium]